MNFFQTIKYKISILLTGICLVTTTAYGAGSPHTKIDGYNEKVDIFTDNDPMTGFSVIFGGYGTASPTIVAITDPTLVHTYNPLLAASHSNSATTTAVAIWKAYDLIGGFDLIQAAVADTSGWTALSAQTISDPLVEIPLSEYKVSISDDGTTIGVSWTSYILLSGTIVIRSVTSTDGGATWSSPITL